MLSYGKNFGDRRGLGFESSVTGSSSSSVTKFVKASQRPNRKANNDQGFGKTNIITSESNLVRTFIDPNNLIRSNKFVPTCHFCGKIGHIIPRCKKLREGNRTRNIISWIF